MEIVRRIVSRYLGANLDVGRGVFTDHHLKLHRYRGSVEVTDMENAGKRGKRVRQLIIVAPLMKDAESDAFLKGVTTDILPLSYDAAKKHLEGLLDQSPKAFELHERQMRGVDVEPEGTTIHLENKEPDGRILTIDASPHKFNVKDSAVIDAPGKAAHGFRQDTLYWSDNKKDGILFYGWLKANMSRAGKMNIFDLRKVWSELGVRYDSH